MRTLASLKTKYFSRLGDPGLRWRRRVVAALLAAFAQVSLAQDTERSGPLYDELVRMDSALFEAAFLACNADKFKAIFTEDAEFYHDRTGASYGDAARTMKQ
jgi:hypothetical protein